MGEKLEIKSKVYLSSFAITRAERLLFITSAKIRTIYGRTNYSLPSRFIGEMGEYIEKEEKDNSREKLVEVNDYRSKNRRSTRSSQKPFVIQSNTKPKRSASSINEDIKLGDKVNHKKWGIGTVVQVKNKDDGDAELTVAFDTEGLKRLLQSIAPIEVVR